MKLRSIGEGSASKVFLVERIADGNSQAGRPTRELTGCLGRQFYAVKVWRRSRLTRVSMGASHTAYAGIDAVMRELSLWSGLECATGEPTAHTSTFWGSESTIVAVELHR